MQQYTIIYGPVESLCAAVNQMIAQGWMPLGPPFKTGTGRDRAYTPYGELAQALVCGDAARRLYPEGVKP
jgi:hypothetical protein